MRQPPRIGAVTLADLVCLTWRLKRFALLVLLTALRFSGFMVIIPWLLSVFVVEAGAVFCHLAPLHQVR